MKLLLLANSRFTVATLLLAALSLPAPAHAYSTTILKHSRLWRWEWGNPPRNFRKAEETRTWLESKPHPRLVIAPEGMRQAVIKFFKLTDFTTVHYAIVGPPRITNGHYPKFWAWLEIEEGDQPSYSERRRKTFSKTGVGQFALEKKGEAHPVLWEFTASADLAEKKDLAQAFPWDALVVIQKILHWKAIKPGN